MYSTFSFRNMLFGALFVSIISFFVFKRRKHSFELDLPFNGIKKGSRIIRAGTRSAVRNARLGLRALYR